VTAVGSAAVISVAAVAFLLMRQDGPTGAG
jgi:hypothetical protein